MNKRMLSYEIPLKNSLASLKNGNEDIVVGLVPILGRSEILPRRRSLDGKRGTKGQLEIFQIKSTKKLSAPKRSAVIVIAN